MIGPVLWVLAVLGVLWTVDRVLLWVERKGWIHYRRRGLSRSGAAYHGLLVGVHLQPRCGELDEGQVRRGKGGGRERRPEPTRAAFAGAGARGREGGIGGGRRTLGKGKPRVLPRVPDAAKQCA